MVADPERPVELDSLEPASERVLLALLRAEVLCLIRGCF